MRLGVGFEFRYQVDRHSEFEWEGVCYLCDRQDATEIVVGQGFGSSPTAAIESSEIDARLSLEGVLGLLK